VHAVNITANEQSIAGEDSTVVSIFEEEADAVLGVARRVQGFHLDVLADREGLAMSGSLVDLVAVLAANDGERVAFEDLCVSTCVVVVAVYGSAGGHHKMKTQRDILVSVDDVCELDAAVFGFLEMWQDSEYTLDTTLV
jgi:hypothetical protein